jgi:hypothetical protein
MFLEPRSTAVVALATQTIAEAKGDSYEEAPAPLSVPRGRLIDRLGEQIIQEMLHDSHSGATAESG